MAELFMKKIEMGIRRTGHVVEFSEDEILNLDEKLTHMSSTPRVTYLSS